MRVVHIFLKRCMDVAGAFFGLLILSPFLLLIALLIKIDSPGAVFFLQERLGKNGRVFKIIKFRTMVVGAEAIGDGLRVSTAADFRITKIGGFLRSTSMDELPQLFCVLRGHMSLVGPRPPVTWHPYNGHDGYPDWAKPRFLMRPGVTGLAQVKVRNSVDWDERIRHDNEYIAKFNIWQDIKILFLTILKTIRPQPLYSETLTQVPTQTPEALDLVLSNEQVTEEIYSEGSNEQ